MNSSALYDNVQSNLLLLAMKIEQSNSLGLLSDSTHAENLFLRLFNMAFGWELTNGNSEKMHQNGYDLIDSKRNLYIQITANKTIKKKIKYSLEQMEGIETSEGAELIVFFIRHKITPIHKKTIYHNGLKYWGADLNWLLKEIFSRCDASLLSEINAFLTKELAPLIINLSDGSSVASCVSLRQELVLEKDGFYVQRGELVEKIFEFSQQDSGLLVGGPGFGKSYVINSLQSYYYKRNIPCYVLRINELIDGSPAEINENLGFADGWLDKLALIKSEDKDFKALLIFDGLDTAKNERLKEKVFKYIRASTKKLGSTWNILAGCRTYDAVKSISLQLLFPSGALHADMVGCRHIEIPIFSESEVKEILALHPKMGNKVKDCTDSLLELLKVPYFMGLLEEIVNHKTDQSLNLSAITTESQLLNFYWKIKVEQDRKLDMLAHKITSAFAGLSSLSLQTYDIIAAEDAGDFEELLMQGIITEHGLHRKSISFAHNILLEYAVSHYLLFEKCDKQIDFISCNQKLPFLFRQSFVYFYNDLWHYKRTLFWEHYFEIKLVNEPLFRLFHQTIIDYVLIETYTELEELTPLSDELDTVDYAEAVRRILESSSFITKGALRVKDVVFAARLCENLHIEFIWELGRHLETAIGLYSNHADPDIMLRLSEASRKYMDYVLKERLVYNQKNYIDSNAGYRGIKNLCSTFSFDPLTAEIILKAVLNLLEEDDFPIVFFSTLAGCIDDVFKSNPELGAYIYNKIYYHRETSKKPTSMGSAVMPLRSNRQQDFVHNYYILEKKFKELLQINFVKACSLGADIVNRAATEESYRRDGNIFSFFVGKIPASIILDYSYYEKNEKNGPFSHGKLIFEFLENQTENSRILKNWIIEIITVLKAAYLWRRLLKFLKENTVSVQDIVFDILSNKIFFETDETFYEAVSLLENAWPLMNQVQQRKIEEKFFDLLHPEPLFHNELWLENRLRKILSVIPYSALQLEATKDFLDKNEIIENKSLLSRGLQAAQAHSLTEAERKSAYGFIKEDKKHIRIYELFRTVERFNESFMKRENDDKDTFVCEEEFDAALQLFNSPRMKSPESDLMQASCDGAVASFANIVSALPKIPEGKFFFIKEIALYFISIDKYKENTYEPGEFDSRSGKVHASNARNTSVKTLLNLMYDSKDLLLEQTVLGLMNDNAISVRLKMLPALSYFWKESKAIFWEKVFERAEAESDGFCMNEIINKLCFDDVISDNITNIEKVSLLIGERLAAEDGEAISEIWRSFVVLQLIRVLRHDRNSALLLIEKNFKNLEFSRNLIYEINNTIESINKGTNYVKRLNEFSVLMDIYKDILKYRFGMLDSQGVINESSGSHFEILDLVVENIYFILDHENHNGSRRLNKIERKALNGKLIPLLELTANESEQLESGFMAAHTGYYFMKSINLLIDMEPQVALDLSVKVVVCAAKNGFTYDQSTLREVIMLTERLIADHKKVLSITDNFDKLIIILDQFAQSGSQEALQLTWSLKDAF